jgi:histidinol-phosphatase (PHP family)
MIVLQNLHTHCSRCDGKDSAEDVIIQALAKGIDSIGFSSHSPMFYAPEHGMAEENVAKYVAEIRALQEKYKDRIAIFCGLELDLFSGTDLSPFDYVIGSVHYLKRNGEYIGFDRNLQTVQALIDTHFGGNGMLYAKTYYETLAELPACGRIDIVGHFDLITKHADTVKLFDEDSKLYRSYALEAVDALIGKIPFFEINTGAIARGYRKTPYPSAFLLKEIKRRGGSIVISSDCHDKNYLLQSFSEAAELAMACGFRETYVKTERGFSPVPLDELKKRLRL